MKIQKTKDYIFYSEFEDELIIFTIYADWLKNDDETISKKYILNLEFKEDIEIKINNEKVVEFQTIFTDEYTAYYEYYTFLLRYVLTMLGN